MINNHPHNHHQNHRHLTNGPVNQLNGRITPLGYEKLTNDVTSGQQALDQLLASLAIESDVNEQHLANIENNNYATVKKLKRLNGLDRINGNNHDLELSAIIADLTEFGSQHSSADSNSNWTKANGDLNGYGSTSDKSEPMNQTVKKLMSESESSSSISPSLSERSNAVSWSDQVFSSSFFMLFKACMYHLLFVSL